MQYQDAPCGASFFDLSFTAGLAYTRTLLTYRSIDMAGIFDQPPVSLPADLRETVARALEEDIGRGALTGERTSLKFLQTLSGTATRAHRYAEAVAGTGVHVLDTRKTLPGLRSAQKYAVRCGGCYNHRMGLYDAVLIKENHIAAAGSIAAAVAASRGLAPGKPVEVEVESLDELRQALDAEADVVLLDNFPLESLVRAVQITAGRAKLEASGGINLGTLRAVAETGVDYISAGDITKDVKAVDLSLRFVARPAAWTVRAALG